MKRLFKINRKKPPKPPHQPIPPETPADTAPGPPDLGAELDVTSPGDGGQNVSDNDLEADHTDLLVPRNEGGKIGPRVLFQDGMDGDQELPASEGASTSVVAIGGAGYGNQLGSKCFRFLRWNIRTHLYHSIYQPRVLATLEDRSGQRRHPRVCEHVMIASALINIYRALVAKKTDEHTLPAGAKNNTGKFGPLKVVLEKIRILFANRTVRLRSPA